MTDLQQALNVLRRVVEAFANSDASDLLDCVSDAQEILDKHHIRHVDGMEFVQAKHTLN